MVEHLRDNLGQIRDDVADAIEAYVTKPLLRGVSHVLAFLASIVSGIVLIAQATASLQVAASIVYGLGLSAALAASALFHRVRWKPTGWKRMRKIDHSMIFVLVASSYTPLLLLAFDGAWRATWLVVVWGLAAAGITLRLAVSELHRGLLAACYLGMGWVSLLLLPQVYANVPATVFGLLVACGALYTVGAIVYILQRPNPLPRIFGFHEVFHALVIAAAVCHYAAVYPLITA